MRSYSALRILAAALLFFIAGCSGNKLNEYLSFWRGHTIPYGCYFAYENLQQLFPNAEIVIADRSPDLFKSDYEKGSLSVNNYIPADGGAYIIIGRQFRPDASEVSAIKDFIGLGNTVFISSLEFDQVFLDSFGLTLATKTILDDSLFIKIINPADGSLAGFGYPGLGSNNSFLNLDSSRVKILGYNGTGEPNFINLRFPGGGNLFVHTEPFAFSNFFLLHKDNSQYYNFSLSYISPNFSDIFWDEYYRHNINTSSPQQSQSQSKLAALQKYPALRWALWLSIALFVILYLFESKRKQRIIPIINPLRNSSLDFVKTISSLYFQRKDNKDLAFKMTAHWFEYIRSKYQLHANDMSSGVLAKLASRSEYPREKLDAIAYQFRYLQARDRPEDDELMHYYELLKDFYNHR